MRALVVGFGSIGMRHVRLLNELGCKVGVVTSRDIAYELKYNNLSDAVNTLDPDYVVISNKTEQHYKTLLELANLKFSGTVLVEKPIFNYYEEVPENRFTNVFVAYNLRFHPLIQRIASLIKNEKLISVYAYAGQYLPLWRPNSDYRKTYSARRGEGGGVIRDLSHELDYLCWLLGGWKYVTALGGHYSHLAIDSDDVFSIMMETPKCPVVTVQLNYLDRVARREILINTDRQTVKADLIQGTLSINENSEKIEAERDFTYCAQHHAILNKNYGPLCTLKEGLEVMRLIEAAEMSMHQKVWISND